MKILVNGAGGQLGREIAKRLSAVHCVRPFTRAMWDVTDEAATRQIVEREAPDVVVHCAAYTAVDQCEKDAATAFAVNAYGTRNVAAVCGECGIALAYISTDYVFDGEKEAGYDEWDTTRPLNVYGRSKEAGEQFVRQLCRSHFILRTAWLYGVHGNNFVKTIVAKARKGGDIAVVNDQTGSPTYAGHLAAKIGELVATRYYGTYHLANRGSCTWYEFAQSIVERLRLKARILPISSQELGRSARRPRFSTLQSLSLAAQCIASLPHWREGMSAFLQEWEGKSGECHIK